MSHPYGMNDLLHTTSRRAWPMDYTMLLKKVGPVSIPMESLEVRRGKGHISRM